MNVDVELAIESIARLTPRRSLLGKAAGRTFFVLVAAAAGTFFGSSLAEAAT